MKTVRVNITLTDRRQYEIRDKEYCDETFGEDYLEDYGVDIPEDLVLQYKELMARLRPIQKALGDIYEGREND